MTILAQLESALADLEEDRSEIRRESATLILFPFHLARPTPGSIENIRKLIAAELARR